MDFRYSLPAKLEQDFSAAVTDWEKGKIDRLWARDASLWTNQDESKWLGWLDIVERQQNDLQKFRALAQDIKTAGFESALLLGMGGSSLCPEVLAETFGQPDGFPRLFNPRFHRPSAGARCRAKRRSGEDNHPRVE